MIDATDWIWISAGAAVGMLQTVSLWRSVHHPTVYSPLWGLLRLAAVAAVLVVAAISGEVLWAAAGWAIGFAISVGWFGGRRWRGNDDEMSMRHAWPSSRRPD
ncbi:hypothetical protein FYK55_04975 [Roseiconus nitratireducens]|uniref:Uncharacterized protein n=1 Tax=Roseiconus nitratireducens TaxID=2605748 RepID=A0A5M6DJ19_9BACT|nr:hypothetical protein [Roseiconus nitratireducens]KAA5546242.1 hypothetical protein FYK55_04975 [Roseiconus nitratireducens]